MVFNQKLIDFFKRHNLYDKETFDYLSQTALMIDYKDEEQRPLIGCYHTEKDGKVKNVYLIIPYIYNEITMLINIHEFIHAIMLYKRIGKKANINLDKEILPMLYEKIYINETNSTNLKNYEEELNQRIDKEKDLPYALGLKFSDELLKEYNYNFSKINKKAKKLVKRRKKI